MGSAYGVTKKVCLQNRRKTIKKIFFLYFEMAQSRKTWPLRASASKRGRVENYPFVCCGNKTDFYYSSLNLIVKIDLKIKWNLISLLF
jgi:hypothetical protein